MSPPRPHFLVLTYPLQGHIAPALRLAWRLLAVAPDVLVTLSTTEAAHIRMFQAKPEEGPIDDGRLEFLPFSDGTEGGYAPSSDVGAFNTYIASFHAAGPRSVGELMDAMAERGRPVSGVVYTLMLPWAADVARERGVPSALYWIQPVVVFAIYHHYFHGYAGVIAEHYRRGDPSLVVELPGLWRSRTCRPFSPNPPTPPTISTLSSSRSATCSTALTGGPPRPPSSSTRAKSSRWARSMP